MVTVNPQYVVDEKQQRRAVLISIDERKRILDDLEELDDVRAYDLAKTGPQNAVPFEQAVREIEDWYRRYF